MYNDTTITIVGNITDEPQLRRTNNGHAVINLRIASTSRRRDRDTGEWSDDAKLFITATCWRRLAENVAASMHKGDPVVVTGRIFTREYEVNESKRLVYELEANAVGHDLARGVARFERVVRPSAVVQVPVDENGRPVDESEHWLNLQTGEVTDAGQDTGAEPAGHPDGADERELAPAG